MTLKPKSVSIIFVPTTLRTPTKSGNYLIHTHGGNFTTLSYSKLHNKWNMEDKDPADAHWGFEATDSYIVAWADIKLPTDALKSLREVQNG